GLNRDGEAAAKGKLANPDGPGRSALHISSPLEDKANDIPVHDEEHQGNEEGKSHQVNEAFFVGSQGPPPDQLDAQEDQLAAIQGWNGKQVKESQVDADEGSQVQHVD